MADMINNIPDEEAEDITVELELEDGKLVNCAIITILEVNGKDYIALLPMVDEDDENYGDVWFYEYLEDDDDPDDEPELKYIEDDEEYEAVADAFDEFLDKQEYDEIMCIAVFHMDSNSAWILWIHKPIPGSRKKILKGKRCQFSNNLFGC